MISGRDVVEGAGFEAVAGGLRVAVHGVTAPQHVEVGFVDRCCQCRQLGADFFCAEAVDERESSGRVVGVENFDQVDQFIGRDGVAHLDTDGVADAAEVLDMSAVDGAGAIADPGQVGAEVVIAPLPLIGAGERLFVQQMQAFMRGEEIDAAKLFEFSRRKPLP